MKAIILMLCTSVMTANYALANEYEVSKEPQKVVAEGGPAVKNQDALIEFVLFEPEDDFLWYVIKNSQDLKILREDHDYISHINAVLENKELATKVFREVFTLNELTLLQNKIGGFLNRSLHVTVMFDTAGKIFDAYFMFYSKKDADIRRIFTPTRLKTLYIKLRDQLKYAMPHPDSSLSYYSVIFPVKFSDILLNRPILTN